MDLNSEITLRELQNVVDKWISGTDVGYFSPLTNMAMLTEETGEVARVIARTYGEQRSKQGEVLDLADELADLIWVAVAIANQTGIDLSEAIQRNLQKKKNRDSSRFNIDK